MSSSSIIAARQLGKVFRLYDRPIDRLKQMIMRSRRRYFREFTALHDVSFELEKGQVLGLVGRNGAGKSTLLQLVCGTLTPSHGNVAVRGRVAALLELGAGFNPDFSGRENIYLNASILGLSKVEIDQRYDAIVEFSGIGDFIEQPVKTYSSGMYVRLAFSIATSVDPDILVIDEALSVGDGAFARKSFERIMRLKDAGKTILFCSHSMYQVEALCSRALWLEQGQVRAMGNSADVIRSYTAFLDEMAGQASARSAASASGGGVDKALASGRVDTIAQSRIEQVRVTVDGVDNAIAFSGRSTVRIEIAYRAKDGDTPSLAVTFNTLDGRCVTSSGTLHDGVVLPIANDGTGRATCVFEKIPLLRGEYSIAAWLLCDRALFVHEEVQEVCRLTVVQEGLEQGLVRLSHQWQANC